MHADTIAERPSATRAPADARATFLPGLAYPLVLEPARQALRDDPAAAAGWFAQHQAEVDALAERHGAVLLRGFAVRDTADFGRWANAFPGGPLDYEMGASPRQELRGRVFESTRFPMAYRIGLHNELSYMRDYPRRIVFFCRQSSSTGGETILGDMEQVHAALPASVRDAFETRGLRYLRNFRFKTPGERPSRLDEVMHRGWNEIFGTDDRAEAQARCDALGLAWTWLADGGLRTEYHAPAVRLHPRRGRPVWFNQATTFHPNARSLGSIYPLVARRYPDPESVPYTVTFGDGEPIPFAVLEPVYDALDRLTVAFPWRNGDVLILDNLRIAHGRNPFTGARDVQVFMAR